MVQVAWTWPSCRALATPQPASTQAEGMKRESKSLSFPNSGSCKSTYQNHSTSTEYVKGKSNRPAATDVLQHASIIAKPCKKAMRVLRRVLWKVPSRGGLAAGRARDAFAYARIGGVGICHVNTLATYQRTSWPLG